MLRALLVSLSMVLLAACGGEVVTSPTQQWKDMSFRIETRPPTIKPGMIEFLVIANRGERKRAHDLLVSLRIGEQGRWTQAIQDGAVGVYRRALRVNDPANDVLNVYIRHKDEETILKFPLDFGLPG